MRNPPPPTVAKAPQRKPAVLSVSQFSRIVEELAERTTVELRATRQRLEQLRESVPG